jgi:SpoVK/Ycf46/Vps4 family AAA+-type ATPase
VLTLLILMLMMLVLVAMATSAARRARRREEERRRAEMERRAREGNGDGPSSPFAGMPFGGLFDVLLSGGGGWSRSYEYDEESGRWIDVSERHPEPVAEPEQAADTPTRKPRRRQRQGTTTSPLGGLFGMPQGTEFEVQPPEELIDFDDVGGMDDLKREVRDTIGLMLKHPEDAERYGIEWNGILLHGPPGVGKTFFARAIAGEYGLNLIHVSTGDLVASLVGQSAQNIEKAFDTALDNLPALLFFDEFDSVAQRRDNSPDQEARRTVNQLLTSLEAHRDERRLLVMAATNSIEHLDPAVIRPGRFDRHIRIDLPDADARREVFETELDDRPAARDLDLDELVRRTEGMTPAAISKIVDSAALEVFREAKLSGKHLELDTGALLRAIEHYGGRDRPTVEHWTWDSLVLPPAIKAQLRQLQAVIEDPECRQGPRRPGPCVLLSHLRRRRDQQVGGRVRAQPAAAVRAGTREPAVHRVHRRDRRDRGRARRDRGA